MGHSVTKNAEVAEQLWSRIDGLSHSFRGSLSTFEPQGNNKEDWVCTGIDLIEQHHGEYAQTKPYTTLVVIESKPTQLIVETLSEVGHFAIEESQDGFIATGAAGVIQP